MVVHDTASVVIQQRELVLTSVVIICGRSLVLVRTQYVSDVFTGQLVASMLSRYKYSK